MRIVVNTKSEVRVAGVDLATNKPTTNGDVEVVSGGPYHLFETIVTSHQGIMNEAHHRAAATLAEDEIADLGVAFHAGVTPGAERFGYSRLPA